jgi:hypothetical protein
LEQWIGYVKGVRFVSMLRHWANHSATVKITGN